MAGLTAPPAGSSVSQGCTPAAAGGTTAGAGLISALALATRGRHVSRLLSERTGATGWGVVGGLGYIIDAGSDFHAQKVLVSSLGTCITIASRGERMCAAAQMWVLGPQRPGVCPCPCHQDLGRCPSLEPCERRLQAAPNGLLGEGGPSVPWVCQHSLILHQLWQTLTHTHTHTEQTHPSGADGGYIG